MFGRMDFNNSGLFLGAGLHRLNVHPTRAY